MARKTKRETLESIRQMLQHPELELDVPTIMGIGAPIFSWRTEGFGPMASGTSMVAKVGSAYFEALPGVESGGPYGSLKEALFGSVWFSDGVRHQISFEGELREFVGAFRFDHVSDWDAIILVNGDEMTMNDFKEAVEEAAEQESKEENSSSGSVNAATTTDLRVLAVQALRERGNEMSTKELRSLELELERLMEEQELEIPESRERQRPV